MKIVKSNFKAKSGKVYHKFYVNLKKKLIESLGWEQGDSLKGTILRGKLILEKEDEGDDQS